MQLGSRDITFGKLTDEGIERMRQRIGQPITRKTAPFARYISQDVARNWARAIGDLNPLYSDPVYGQDSAAGAALASPTVLYATDNVVSGAVSGLAGVHAMFAGTEWTWHRTPRVGDEVETREVLEDAVIKETKFASRAIQEIYRVEFEVAGELIASARSWCFRTERDTAREDGTKYREEREIEPYSAEDLEEISEAYRRERAEIRGADTRFLDEAAVGDSLGRMARGPYTLTTAVGFMQCWGSYAIFSHGNAFDYFNRHPSLAILNEYGVPELPVRVHWDEKFAREVGAPGAYDFGPERISWLGTYVTNWMSDRGELRRLSARLRRHNAVGDTVWCTGQISEVRPGEGGGEVDINLTAHNQNGALSAEGSATVWLPARS